MQRSIISSNMHHYSIAKSHLRTVMSLKRLRYCHFPFLKSKVKRTDGRICATWPSPDNVVSYATQYDSFETNDTQRGGIKYTQAITNLQNKTNAIAKSNARLMPRPNCTFQTYNLIMFEDVKSYSRMSTNHVKITIDFTSRALLTVGSFLDSGVSPSPVKKDFLPPARKKSIKSTKSPQLQAVNWKVVNINGNVPFHSHRCFMRTGLVWVVENLAVDVWLETSLIDYTLAGSSQQSPKSYPGNRSSWQLFTRRRQSIQ